MFCVHVRKCACMTGCSRKHQLCRPMVVCMSIVSKAQDSPLEAAAIALQLLEGLPGRLENLLPEKQVHQLSTDVLTATGHADPLVCLHGTPGGQGYQGGDTAPRATLRACLKGQEATGLKRNYIFAARRALRRSFCFRCETPGKSPQTQTHRRTRGDRILSHRTAGPL